MKIEYKVADKNDRLAVVSRSAFTFAIKESIMKEHYKELARMSRHFKNNSGHIESKNKDAFIALVEKIEAYNSASCEKSHKKCVEKRAAKVVEKAKISISFEDYCDDMLDISFDLLSREEKTATRNAYRGLVA